MTDGPIDGGKAARPKLFQPFAIRGLTLKNRLVVPPMVHYRAEPGNTCGTFHLVHLGRYALGGFGLVFVEATAVEEVGLINEHDLGIWNEAQAESFKPLIAFMRRQNTAIGIQLAHGGRKSSSQTAMQGMGPLTEENLKAGAKIWQPVADGRAGCQRLAHAAAANDSRLQSDGPHLGGCGEKCGQGRLRCDRNSRCARLSARFVPVSGLKHTQ